MGIKKYLEDNEPISVAVAKEEKETRHKILVKEKDEIGSMAVAKEGGMTLTRDHGK